MDMLKLNQDVFVKNYMFNDPVACPQDPSQLSLDRSDILDDYAQSVSDLISFNVGTQMAGYGGK